MTTLVGNQVEYRPDTIIVGANTLGFIIKVRQPMHGAPTTGYGLKLSYPGDNDIVVPSFGEMQNNELAFDMRNVSLKRRAYEAKVFIGNCVIKTFKVLVSAVPGVDVQNIDDCKPNPNFKAPDCKKSECKTTTTTSPIREIVEKDGYFKVPRS